MTIEELPLTLPTMTSWPTRLGTGFDSPAARKVLALRQTLNHNNIRSSCQQQISLWKG